MKKLQLFFSLLVLFTGLFSPQAFSQEIPFEREVEALDKRIAASDWQEGSILFTGSSSIRFWTSLSKDFPEQTIINTGFGGSQASDLIIHLETLVLKYKPSKVFIYEGDNDIWADEEPLAIMGELDTIVQHIKKSLPDTEIFLISAKPSPSRWEKKNDYLELNLFMKEYSGIRPGIKFVDIWDVMLNEKGEPIQDIFIQDDLHMNPDGYKIWKQVFTPFVNQ